MRQLVLVAQVPTHGRRSKCIESTLLGKHRTNECWSRACDRAPGRSSTSAVCSSSRSRSRRSAERPAAPTGPLALVHGRAGAALTHRSPMGCRATRRARAILPLELGAEQAREQVLVAGAEAGANLPGREARRATSGCDRWSRSSVGSPSPATGSSARTAPPVQRQPRHDVQRALERRVPPKVREGDEWRRLHRISFVGPSAWRLAVSGGKRHAAGSLPSATCRVSDRDHRFNRFSFGAELSREELQIERLLRYALGSPHALVVSSRLARLGRGADLPSAPWYAGCKRARPAPPGPAHRSVRKKVASRDRTNDGRHFDPRVPGRGDRLHPRKGGLLRGRARPGL